jgi:hypothetical protein
MQPLTKACFVLLVLGAAQAACRGTLPPTEPPRSGDASPGTRTNDSPISSPLAGEGAPTDTLTGTGSGGTNALPLPVPSGGSSAGSGPAH